MRRPSRHGIFRIRSILIMVAGSLLLPSGTPAQSVILPVTHRAYEFLARVESKGLLLEYRDAVRPLSRNSIAHHLLSLVEQRTVLTDYEQEELSYLLGEFHQEIASLRHAEVASEDQRWNLISIPVRDGWLRANLLGGYSALFREGKHAQKRQAGFQVAGTIFGRVGYYFNFLSNRETGPLVSLSGLHTPEQGVAFFNTPENVGGYEYSTTDVMLSYDLGDLSLAVEKTNNAWGEDRFGNVILSSKPPSFPKVSLRVSITDWLDFSYIHGDLHSLVVDSSRSYIDRIENREAVFRTVYRQKYIASHMLQFSPWEWMDIGLGESVIYSDKDPQLIYILPIMFFKSGEHYNRDTDNSHFFGTVDVRPHRGVSLYGSFFIDELAVGDIFNAERNRNWVAVSLGSRIYDLAVENTEIFIEYSRANPWVYTHKYDATTYSSNGFPLGHWIDQNADLLSLELRYHPTRRSLIRVLFQNYRKGDTLSTWHQYNPPTEQFLFGRRRSESSITISATYEFLRDVYAELRYRNSSLSDQHDPFLDYAGRSEFFLQLRYGVW